MTDPIEGRWGSLILSGWVADAPTGHEEAFLLVTTPDERAEVTMPLVAAGFGLTPGQVSTSDRATVEVGADGWAALLVAGERYPRPVNDHWRQTALSRRQVVLVVGMAPHPPGMGLDAYTERYGARSAIGLVRVTT